MNYDEAYSNADFIKGAEAYPKRWAADAASWREKADARLDIPYGTHARQRFDLFSPKGIPRGLVVFVHGGYWLKFDKSLWSHLAEGAVARGWAVAMPSYRLAQEVCIADITRDVRSAVLAAAAQVAAPIVLTGHSAGGHLVARLLCADANLPADVAERIVGAVPISGVADLRPLMHTAMNKIFDLDEAAATAESPALQPLALTVPTTVWVGADERPVFLEQSEALATAWNVPLHIAPGLHHFDVIDDLQNPESGLMETLLGGG
ncbi:alpha/beta hydrolase [Actibacterium lipolyticum]|uniref:Alpha/beta hydrolase family protein n=1 Tax=Actibacterium lipolyticum TaxID=1524263 RepID=A0A238KRG5_9RHOB|nr:alpha/beta hydrolase [Actibacterium lipolyticum]SMX45434.1 Alpha/beta hydrolase family protein [Actibacterium lipolyticum]